VTVVKDDQPTLDRLTAGDVMTRNPLVVPFDATIDTAMTAMRITGVRHLPVLHMGRLVGLIDDRAVAFALLGGTVLRSLLDHPVDALMVHLPAQTDADTPLTQVAQLLRTSRCDAVVVVDREQCLIGLITRSDLVTAVAALASRDEVPAAPAPASEAGTSVPSDKQVSHRT
jgi:predicted transcriptional regulator